MRTHTVTNQTISGNTRQPNKSYKPSFGIAINLERKIKHDFFKSPELNNTIESNFFIPIKRVKRTIGKLFWELNKALDSHNFTELVNGELKVVEIRLLTSTDITKEIKVNYPILSSPRLALKLDNGSELIVEIGFIEKALAKFRSKSSRNENRSFRKIA